MSPTISERSFEEAIECGLLQHGPNAYAADATAVHETPPPFGATPPGGYRKRGPGEYDRTLCLLPREWKGTETTPEGDFFVRSGPGTVKLSPESAREYVRTRFGGTAKAAEPA